MARSRNIKPGFFTNDDLVECGFATRLLFAGLWTIADRDGRLEDRPKKIKIAIFPADNLDLEEMLEELHSRKFIQRYAVNGVGYIQIISWSKHQNPHHTEKASEIPGPNSGLTVKEPLEPKESPKQDGGNLADSLDSDSGFLITDSGFTDSQIPSLFGQPPAEDKPAKVRKVKEPTPTGAVWQAYSAAYLERYGVEPVRNAAVNGKLAQVVDRLGAEAGDVAEFYLTHKNRYYVEKMHPVGLLLSDAEKLRTEWATGRQVTATQAQQADKTQSNFNAFAPMLAEARAKEMIDAKH